MASLELRSGVERHPGGSLPLFFSPLCSLRFVDVPEMLCDLFFLQAFDGDERMIDILCLSSWRVHGRGALGETLRRRAFLGDDVMLAFCFQDLRQHGRRSGPLGDSAARTVYISPVGPRWFAQVCVDLVM